MQTVPIRNRVFSRSTTGARLFTSAVLPGRPELAAYRGAVLIQHHAHHHLLQIGTMILGVATPTEGLAPLSLEVDRGAVEEHQVQLGEQVPALGEQLLFDEILDGSRCKGRGAALVVLRQFLSQPSHGAVEMTQAQAADAGHGVVVFPLLGSAVAAGREQTMQDSQENGPFHGELEAAVAQQMPQNLVDRAGFPEPLKDQGGADPGTPGGDAFTARLCAEHRQFLGEPSQRLDQSIEPTFGQKLIEAAEPEKHALFDLTVHPLIVYDE